MSSLTNCSLERCHMEQCLYFGILNPMVISLECVHTYVLGFELTFNSFTFMCVVNQMQVLVITTSRYSVVKLIRAQLWIMAKVNTDQRKLWNFVTRSGFEPITYKFRHCQSTTVPSRRWKVSYFPTFIILNYLKKMLFLSNAIKHDILFLHTDVKHLLSLILEAQ